MRISHAEAGEATAKRIAAEVRAEMARQGISQQALALRLGWLQPRVSRRLTDGETFVPFDTQELAAVAHALGVDVSHFMPAARAA